MSIEKSSLVKVLSVILVFSMLLVWRLGTPSLAADPNGMYLPLVSSNFPPPPTVFGVEVHSFTHPDVVQLAIDSRVSWVRIAAFDWSKIEPTAPVNFVHTYDWSQVPESSLENIGANRMRAIATVKMTPSWAQKYPSYYCGPIAQDNLDDFAAFMKAAVERYSQPPYNVHYWELGNEPDVAKELVPEKDYPFGCWGELSEDYYGGEYYAEMLKVVYPAIKSADPDAQVLIGGLLLDCDPDDPDCSDPNAPKFFEGILRNGGAQYFDIVGYHAYPKFNDSNPDDPFKEDIEHYKWDLRGGLTLGKIDYLNEVMDKYSVTKPVMLTEGGLMCYESSVFCTPSASKEFLDAQASYVVLFYVRSWAEGIQNAVWYTFEGIGWRSVGMIGSDPDNPRPAYRAFNFITEELSDAHYLGKVDTGSELAGYAFSKFGKEIWVMWSPNSTTYTYTLPVGYSKVLDKYGKLIVPDNGKISIKSPVYIEF